MNPENTFRNYHTIIKLTGYLQVQLSFEINRIECGEFEASFKISNYFYQESNLRVVK